MNENVAGAILLVTIFGGLVLFFGGSVQPDLSKDLPARSGSAAHPLWSE